jgi:lipopolysaccharide/colanic/teichoic acid biosynthesis glycosyltransferase
MLSVRPGLTGPASLCFINEEEILSNQENPQKYNDEVLFPEKVRINNNYIKKWSFMLDLKIIIHTISGRKLKYAWAQDESQKLANSEPRTFII